MLNDPTYFEIILVSQIPYSSCCYLYIETVLLTETLALNTTLVNMFGSETQLEQGSLLGRFEQSGNRKAPLLTQTVFPTSRALKKPPAF